MKILIDECLPKALLRALEPHEVRTVVQMKWDGVENGDLLTLAETKFDIFITGDRNLSFQQNVSRYKIAVIVIRGRGTRMDDLSPILPKLQTACESATPGTVAFIAD